MALAHVPGAAPVDHVGRDGGSWFRTDGLPLAPSVGAFLAQSYGVKVPLNVSARGQPLMGKVWTGMGPAGPDVDFGSSHCQSWTNATGAQTGVVGTAHVPGDAFSRAASSEQLACDQVAHLYCFQQ